MCAKTKTPGPSLSLLILSDDLTGAADSAARCRQAGLPAHIFLQPPVPPLPAGAVACTSDSRHLPPAAAAKRVRTLVKALADVPHTIWYKKIDSTLRGNLGSELDALLDLSAPGETGANTTAPCAVISPGFPAQARGLHGGRLIMKQTDASDMHLPTLLRAQSQRPVAAIDLDVVRAGVDRLAGALAEAHQNGARLLVVDGMTEDDLQTLLTATRQALPQALFCGSAGLVGVLALSLAAKHETPEPAMATMTGALAVVGSGSAMAHRQLDALRARPDVRLIQTHPDASAVEATSLPQTPPATKATVLHLPPPPVDAVLDGPQARRMAEHLADVAATWIAHADPQRLVLVGGDTSVALLARLGVERLTVQHEVLPGMPLTIGTDRSLDGDGRTRQIILKAGNHGDEGTLVTLLGLAR